MYKRIQSGILALLLIVCCYSCDKEMKHPAIENQAVHQDLSVEKSGTSLQIIKHSQTELQLEYLADGYQLILEGNFDEDFSYSTLRVYHEASDQLKFGDTLFFNDFGNGTKYEMRNTLVGISNAKLATLTLSSEELQVITNTVNEFLLDFGFAFDRALYHAESTFAVFYQVSVLNMLGRAKLADAQHCTCGTFNKYLFDETPFICNEDLVYDASIVTDYFSNAYTVYDSEKLDLLGVNAILEEASTSSTMTQAQIEAVAIMNAADSPITINDQTQSAERLSCKANSSSSLGCCGNNGSNNPCKRCRIICLLHDVACWNCGQGRLLGGLFCGSNCNPEDSE